MVITIEIGKQYNCPVGKNMSRNSKKQNRVDSYLQNVTVSIINSIMTLTHYKNQRLPIKIKTLIFGLIVVKLCSEAKSSKFYLVIKYHWSFSHQIINTFILSRNLEDYLMTYFINIWWLHSVSSFKWSNE